MSRTIRPTESSGFVEYAFRTWCVSVPGFSSSSRRHTQGSSCCHRIACESSFCNDNAINFSSHFSEFLCAASFCHARRACSFVLNAHIFRTHNPIYCPFIFVAKKMLFFQKHTHRIEREKTQNGKTKDIILSFSAVRFPIRFSNPFGILSDLRRNNFRMHSRNSKRCFLFRMFTLIVGANNGKMASNKTNAENGLCAFRLSSKSRAFASRVGRWENILRSKLLASATKIDNFCSKSSEWHKSNVNHDSMIKIDNEQTVHEKQFKHTSMAHTTK